MSEKQTMLLNSTIIAAKTILKNLKKQTAKWGPEDLSYFQLVIMKGENRQNIEQNSIQNVEQLEIRNEILIS